MTTNLTDRYDTRPDVPHGHCVDCDQTMPTHEDARQHMDETLKQSTTRQSHRIRTTNPSRQDRVRNAVEAIIEEHMHDMCREIDDLIDQRDISQDEADTAVQWSRLDLADAWEEYNR